MAAVPSVDDVKALVVRIDELVERYEQCLGEKKPLQLPLAGTPKIVYSVDGSVVFETRPGATKCLYSKVMARLIQQQFPFTTVRLNGELPMPIDLDTPQDMKALLITFKALLEDLGALAHESLVAKIMLGSKLGVITGACMAMEACLAVFEDAINCDERVSKEASEAAARLKEMDEDVKTLNTVLAKYPEIEEALPPSMRNAGDARLEQYDNFTIEQLRLNNARLYHSLKITFNKLKAESKNYAKNKAKQEALASLMMQLSDSVDHTIELCVGDEMHALYDVDVSNPVSLGDIEYDILPQVANAFFALHSYSGSIAFKHLVALERILMDISRVMSDALASEPFASLCAGSTETQFAAISEDQTDHLECDDILVECMTMVDVADVMIKDIEAKEVGDATIPVIHVDGNGQFSVNDVEVVGQSIQPETPLTVQALGAPIPIMKTTKTTLKEVSKAKKLLTTTRPALKCMQELSGPKMKPFAVKHYNRIFSVFDWLRQNKALCRHAVPKAQLEHRVAQLNAVAKRMANMEVEWLKAASALDAKKVMQQFNAQFSGYVQWNSFNWNFNHYNLTDDQTKVIGDALIVSKTVTQINMQSAQSMTQIGAKAIARGLKFNTSLTTLTWNYCQMGSEGASAVAAALKQNTTLVTLNLTQCNIGNVEAAPFVELIKTNTTLTTLYLQNTGMPQATEQAIRTAQQTHRPRMQLRMTYC
eukprot:m.127482 g.127482  ORF g.127482 m.127482 type:complete len:707 (+) comp13852_c0_seq16:76-2196(+)